MLGRVEEQEALQAAFPARELALVRAQARVVYAPAKNGSSSGSSMVRRLAAERERCWPGIMLGHHRAVPADKPTFAKALVHPPEIDLGARIPSRSP